ncbi:MAG: c-type cytochrome [Peptococcales bacterium]|jgi:nitric oxide reductase subunit C
MRNIVWLVIISLMTSVTFLVFVFYSLEQMETQKITEEAIQGKKIWDNYGCIQCHTIFGNGGYSAPDLTNVITDRGEGWIKTFFREPPLMPFSKNRRHKQLEEDKIIYLLEYLHLVGKTNTLNWPPSAIKNITENNEVTPK